MELENTRMHDGSRHFVSLPESESWYRLRDHVASLEGAVVTSFLTDNVTEVWIEFVFADNQFTINNQFGEYWFFVENPSCDDAVLSHVAFHCTRLLGR